MRWMKKVSIAFLLIVTLLVIAVAGLVGTQSGLHFMINSAARWVPGLDITSVSGGWRDLTLKGVKYQMPGVNVNVDQLHLSLRLSCLKKSQLCVNALTTEGVKVAINTKQLPPAGEPSPKSEPFTELRTPYPVSLDLLSVKNVTVTVNDTIFALDEFRTAAHWQQKALTLKPTKINGLLVELPKTPPERLKIAEAEGKAKRGSEPEKSLAEILKKLFSQPLLATLPEVPIPLDITVAGISGKQLRLTGDTNITINQFLLQLSNQGQQIQLNKLNVKMPEGSLAINGSATLAQQWPIKLVIKGELNRQEIQGQKVNVKLNGALQEQLSLGLNLSGPVSAKLDAQAELAKVGLPVRVTLESQQLSWPLTGKPEYQLDGVKMRLNGKASGYDLSLRSGINGSEIPPALLVLDAKGNEEQFKLTRLRLSALQGKSELVGVADWSKAVSWNAVLTLSGINTAKQWPEWPAKIDGKIVTRGSLHGGSWQLQIPEITLDGNVKQNLIKAKGKISGNAAGQWNIPQFELALGRNKMNLQGQLSKQWKLDGDIRAPKLDGIFPGLGGVVNGTLKLRGNIQAPQLLVDLNANGLKWQDLRVDRVNVKGDVRSAEQIQGNLAAKVSELKQADLIVRNFTLDAKGNEKQHDLQLKIDGKPIAGQLALHGSFDRKQQRWKGSINNTRFDTPVGEWRLTKAITLDYLNQQQKVTVGPHCWLNPHAQFCVPKSIEAGVSGSASIVLERLDLALIQPLLAPETHLKGIFSGNADVKWSAESGLPQANVNLRGDGVHVKQMVDGTALPVDFQTLTLNAGLKNGTAELNWLFKIMGNGRFNGGVQVADLAGSRKLSGNVDIQDISLALIKPILGKGDKAEGHLNANLRLGGNVRNPLLFGRLDLSALQASGHWIPFDIVQGQMGVNFDGIRSVLDGVIKTPKGQLNLNGDADWRNVDAWHARVTANGDKLRVVFPPMVKIDVSPALVFEASPQLLKLDGSVGIPWARITVKELPESTVETSSDEVILNENLQPLQQKKASIPIQSNLTIHIGDDVRLSAFGLKAQLKGDLMVVQDKQGMGLNGQVDILDGRFRTYGQDLIVRKGLIMFSGPPDQPLLNIEAIRNPDSTDGQVIAGVRVTGLADQPKVEIFSEPVRSQLEALSYLLRGEGLENSNSDNSQMTAILIGLGVAQSGQLVGKIGEIFGVSDLALDTQGVGDKSQVVVSGKITKDLQVKYGVGIFDSLATLTLRYRLMPRLYLEAVSGIDQTLDLLYQFEF
ncbi:translocation and assembly module TamB [Photorhabdus laumondii subsp. laumondii]|uniref:Photorhabdus luminescens subsp. laumondii TTO1 complete genome segment 16/17 n=2 Tax=Photorhabdus laumondii subsp. laumondii TaxID=141679 RepID=Q7MYW3_PHOLL|nr:MULTISPECIES: translocation/assembly module TamB domain-containing protein [Photorhabdus]AWK44080.1 translocation and assembly module TamB [Photorhabdus laumondii subsp. laumondii]AXG44761.1 translocation/assembly module TamB [Photorhabdus laumondii subsp. laumondii]AXG49397.1 translocation/assembly module TamB [Photorhabdus laumondii subsp. laumondii]MCC8382836.1 translocation/assembly module TamB [Photorhabdus laumondii]MCC8386734.1 translocation/assembly module TamB [Photorhabdus laumond